VNGKGRHGQIYPGCRLGGGRRFGDAAGAADIAAQVPALTGLSTFPPASSTFRTESYQAK